MLDVKAWLETLTLKVEEEKFSRAPSLPYIIFTEKRNIVGADLKVCIANRNISVELYSNKIDKEVESNIETLLRDKSIEYEKYRTWIGSEEYFQTVYDFNLIEKI